MERVEKTVFLSYRRTNIPWALAIYQNLTQHGFDVFFDFNGIASGDFERVILGNITSRAHFLVLLTPSALKRCSDAKDWPLRADGSACTLAVNLSARQFEQPGLVDMVTDVLRETGFPAQRLCLEITETTLMSRAQNALDTLHSLKALGLTLAVDDFGTGYSSLAYLKRFPVDTLKIDKTLIDGMTVDADTRAIVSAVISLAKAMELDVVVEGVEQPAQEAELRTMGCQYVQGWLYAKGEPNDQFVARLLAQG